MSLTLSPAVKIFAIVGVVAALALGAGMFVLGGSQPSSSAADLPTSEELRQKRRGAIGAANVVAAGAATRHSKLDDAAAATAAPRTAKKAAPTPAAAPAAKPQAPKRAVKKPLVGPSGLPYEVDEALRRHRAVVVVLYSKDAPVDAITFREAEAGAGDAGAGFVGINVIEQRKGRPVAKQLGVVDTPVVLVYQRPRDVSLRIDGFTDRQTVAQAAHNAGAVRASS